MLVIVIFGETATAKISREGVDVSVKCVKEGRERERERERERGRERERERVLPRHIYLPHSLETYSGSEWIRSTQCFCISLF